jgi:hypothetical protein
MLNIISPIIPNNKNFEASARALTYFSSRRPKNRPSLICLRLAPVIVPFSTLVLSFYISRSTFILKRIIGSNIAIVPQPSKIEENKKNYKTKKTFCGLLLISLLSVAVLPPLLLLLQLLETEASGPPADPCRPGWT